MDGGILQNRMHTWKRIAFRAPKKGEYYVSGAIPAAYKAKNDLSTSFLIVEPLESFEQRMQWVPTKER
jgi:hypothetical protein